jgi:hypothetical protein
MRSCAAHRSAPWPAQRTGSRVISRPGDPFHCWKCPHPANGSRPAISATARTASATFEVPRRTSRSLTKGTGWITRATRALRLSSGADSEHVEQRTGSQFHGIPPRHRSRRVDADLVRRQPDRATPVEQARNPAQRTGQIRCCQRRRREHPRRAHRRNGVRLSASATHVGISNSRPMATRPLLQVPQLATTSERHVHYALSGQETAG